MGEEPSVEAAVIGFEGMVGLPVTLGNGIGPHEVICQVAGGGWRMSANQFKALLPDCPVLRDVLQRYALTFMNQTARSSACNRMHDINQRLARWLLLVHDRVPRDEFGLTQEFLSEMLAAKREPGGEHTAACWTDQLSVGTDHRVGSIRAGASRVRGLSPNGRRVRHGVPLHGLCRLTTGSGPIVWCRT
jgi:hypothetical protein